MRKKFLSVVLVSTMAASLLAGCGGKDDETKKANNDTTKKTEETGTKGGEDTTAAPAGDAKIEAPSTDGWDDSKKIYAYSWDDDFSKKLGVVLDKFPEYKDYVEFVTLGVSGTSDEYKQGIKDALGGDKYPTFIPADNDVAKYFSEDDSITMDLAELGFTEDMLANSYDFAKQYGKFGDKLKCLTWQGCPGSVFYRRDIAKEVLGSDDPEKVQEAMADWDKFFETADKLKAAGYKITSGPDDVKYAIWDSQTQPWVKVNDDGTENLQLDDAVKDYFETGKKLYDGGYTNNTSLWSKDGAWAAGQKSDSKVFCYFCCPWMVGVMQSNGATDGDWGAITGPTSYHWGGTYVSVGKDTNNKELAAFLLYELTCDPDIAVEITNKTGDFCNNKAANERLTTGGELAADNAAMKFLGGQNPIEAWAKAAEGISQANVTYADASIKAFIDDAAKSYNAGELKSVDEAVEFVEKKCDSDLHISK